MNILFFMVFAIWVGAEMVLSTFLRSGNKEDAKRDNKTLIVIWVVTVSSIGIAALAGLCSEFPIWEMPDIRYAGLLVMVAGLALRMWSIVVLGRFFTYNVAVRDGHQLIRTGPYRVLRHPSYTGLLMLFLGYGVAWNNWLSLGVAVVPVVVALARRIAVEERVMAEQFEAVYADYRRRTWRLVPFLY